MRKRIPQWFIISRWLKGGCQRTVQDFIVFQVCKDVWQFFCDGIREWVLICEASGIRFNRIYWKQRVVRGVWWDCGLLDDAIDLWLLLRVPVHWIRKWRVQLLVWQRSAFCGNGWTAYRDGLLVIQSCPRAGGKGLRDPVRC